MKFFKITLLILCIFFYQCQEEKKVKKQQERPKLNILLEKDIDSISKYLNNVGVKNGLLNTTEKKPWFWEIYFGNDSIPRISFVYTRNLSSPYLSSEPTQIYGKSLKLETYDFGKKDSTKTKNYQNSLFTLDSIDLKMVSKLAREAMNLHKRKYYRKQNDTIVGIKIYMPSFSFLYKTNVMVMIGNPKRKVYRDTSNPLSDKLYYATYEYDLKGKLLFSEFKGQNRKYYDTIISKYY